MDEFHSKNCTSKYHVLNECNCVLNPGKSRGIEREPLTGSFKVLPRKHVGHTVTIIGIYRVNSTPVWVGQDDKCGMLKHRVQCSCGEEWDMLDKDLKIALEIGATL